MTRTEPWLVESAIFMIDKFLHPECNVFEFGSGASTLWFSNRSKIISVDHDPAFSTHHTILHERPYDRVINKYPDEAFDLILVDGRDRVKCIIAAIPKLKRGGWLVLDNSEREYYATGVYLMSHWNRVDCVQNQPDRYDFLYPMWTTSIFIKP